MLGREDVAQHFSPDSLGQLGKHPKSVDARDILRALKGHSDISGGPGEHRERGNEL